MEQMVAWSTLVANIVTCAGIITVVITLFHLKKNHVSRRTINISVSFLECFLHSQTEQSYSLLIDIQNFTEKSFFITSIQIALNKNDFVFVESQQEAFGIIQEVRSIKNIPIAPHEAKEVYGILITPIASTPKKCKVKLLTTERKLVYRVTLRKSPHLF